MTIKNLIVGLDMSTVATGVVIMTTNRKVVKSTTIKVSRSKSLYPRLQLMETGVVKELSSVRSRIKMVIIEDVYNIRRNTQCLLEVRGMIISHLMRMRLPFEIMAANTARYGTYVYKGMDAKKVKKLSKDEKKALIKQWLETRFKHKFDDFDQSDAALLCAAYLKETLYD